MVRKRSFKVRCCCYYKIHYSFTWYGLLGSAMDPVPCSFCTPWTSTSEVLPPSRLSFEAFVFFFDRMVILRNRSSLVVVKHDACSSKFQKNASQKRTRRTLNSVLPFWTHSLSTYLLLFPAIPTKSVSNTKNLMESHAQSGIKKYPWFGSGQRYNF